MSQGFDWNDLRPFLAVVRAGTVSEAARRMAVDHSTVIRRIDALERGLGAKLFERNPRGYNLTQRGERLLESAARIEAQAAQAAEEIGEADHISGVVRISSLEGLGNFFLARRLTGLARSHPTLRIELLTIQQILALSRREADIAITVNPPAADRFERRSLTDYHLHVYGSAAYLAKAPAIRTRADFAEHPFSGYIDDLVFTRGLDYLQEVLPGLKPMLQSSSLHAQMEFAAADHGLCVLPSFVARHNPALVPILPDQVALRRTYWMVSAHDALTASVRAVRDFIAAQVKADQAAFLGEQHWN